MFVCLTLCECLNLYESKIVKVINMPRCRIFMFKHDYPSFIYI